VRGCLCEVQLDPAIRAEFAAGRLVWGCQGLFAELRAGLANATSPGDAQTALNASPDAGLVLAA
jgi:hypothetical protein